MHPSIVEVDLEEELSSSDSSTNDDDDDAEDNASEADVSQIPEDLENEATEDSFAVIGVSLPSNVSQSSIPEELSHHDSVEQFFDTVDEPESQNGCPIEKK